MPDFVTGDSVNAVQVKQSNGEYLHYAIDVEGALPNFSFQCNHRHLLSSANLSDHPTDHYEWNWLRSIADSDAGDDDYLVSMVFDGAVTKYVLTIEHRRADDAVIAQLTNLTFATDDPDHLPARQSLRVRVI